jgi:hypothetical protein
MSKAPIPLRPDPTATGKSFWRACAAQSLGRLRSEPASAAAKLFARCPRVDLATSQLVIIPRTVSGMAPAFIAENAPHPVVQAVLDNINLGPACKLMLAAVFSNQIQDYAIETVQVIFAKAFSELAVAKLDSVLLDATAATPGTRPAGLLNSVSDLGPTAGGGIVALTADLAKICGAMSDAGISSDEVMFFCNSRQAIVLKAITELPPENIVGTPAVAAGTLIGIAPDAIVNGFDGAPIIETSTEGTLHMEDTSPVDIAVNGAVPGGSVLSLYQARRIAVRLKIKCAWAPLNAAAVQKIVSMTW